MRTASGAVAVQICEKRNGRLVVLSHIGSAHDDLTLGVLLARARQEIQGGQQAFDFEVEERAATVNTVADWTKKNDTSEVEQPAQMVSPGQTLAATSDVLWQVLSAEFERLQFDQVNDEVFKQLVLARITEPTSKRDAPRIITELGQPAPHRNTITNCLKRVSERDYRDTIAKAGFKYRSATGGVGLILYDVTTLYFEAEHEDEFRKVGFSKERRVDPQIVVGLLVDSSGFPLEVHCFEGNKAETHTIIPVLNAFTQRHGITNLVVVADAGMLSETNLTALENAGYGFIVGSRVSKAPKDLVGELTPQAGAYSDGQIIEATTQVGRGATRRRRVVYQFSRKRWRRDHHTLDLQRERALRIVTGASRPKRARFVKQTAGVAALDEQLLAKARDIAGLKGYVTNIPETLLDGAGVVAAYHDLFQVERSFRMAKTDLEARPMFHHTRPAIEAHLTIVFAALAVARSLQERSGVAIGKIVKELRGLKTSVIEVNGGVVSFPPKITGEAARIVEMLK